MLQLQPRLAGSMAAAAAPWLGGSSSEQLLGSGQGKEAAARQGRGGVAAARRSNGGGGAACLGSKQRPQCSGVVLLSGGVQRLMRLKARPVQRRPSEQGAEALHACKAAPRWPADGRKRQEVK